MTANFPLDFLQKYVSAFARRRSDEVVALMTDDVVWSDPGMVTSPAVGKEAVAHFLQATWEAFPDARFDHPSAVPFLFACLGRTDVFAIPWLLSGTMTGPIRPPGFAPTGRSFSIKGIDIWRFRGDSLCAIDTYYDLADMARQIGVLPPRGSSAEKRLAQFQRVFGSW